MNITVLGASGKTGSELIKQALDAGHTVTAVVRRVGSIETRPNLTVTVGDVTDPSVIASTSKGTDVIVSTLGTMKGTLMTDTVTAVIAASKTTGVKRFILMSSFAVRKEQLGAATKIITGLAMGSVVKDKAASEELLRASDLDWTIVYPTGLANAPKGAKLRVVPLDKKVGITHKTARADVAAWILTEASNNAFVHQDVLITQV